MKVLIACEFSGVVREAFRKRGHDAWSCDLLPTEIPGQHIQGDVLEILNDVWDLMIAHPPCQHLAASGARWWKEKRADGRQQAAIEFFMKFIDAPIKKIAVENPVGIITKIYQAPSQYIQPYQFGENAQKKTGLWLRNLPPLKPTKIVERGEIYVDPRGVKHGGIHTMRATVKRYANQTASGQCKLPPSSDRWKIRSRTFQGIADGMANQWG